MHEPYSAVLRALGAGVLLAALMLPLARPSSAETANSRGEVPFLTLRNTTGSADPGALFGEARSTLSAGRCEVRERDFRSLSPLVEAAPSFIREELLEVARVTLSDPAAIHESLQTGTDAVPPVLYVHGYYMSFARGCQRAAVFQENANLAGRFLWFSWPSNGTLADYIQDEADLYWSVPDIADAIIALERRFGGGVVDVTGHSLGARGIVLALYEVASRAPDIRLDEIVLLAPDMDFGIFQRMLPRIRPIADNITVYVTEGDRPLALSAQLHGYPRLGEAGNGVEVLDGVEVIDLSDLPADSPTGHLYHLYSPDVGADVDQILNGGRRAAERRNLLQAGPNSWRLQEVDRGPTD